MGTKTTHSVPLAITALILGGIATACTESTIVGLLPEIGRSLGVVEESQLSFAITLYMVGVVVGAPIFTVVLVRMNRKRLLLLPSPPKWWATFSPFSHPVLGC